MLLFIDKMGIHWCFRFALKTADSRVELFKCTECLRNRQGRVTILLISEWSRSNYNIFDVRLLN